MYKKVQKVYLLRYPTAVIFNTSQAPLLFFYVITKVTAALAPEDTSAAQKPTMNSVSKITKYYFSNDYKEQSCDYFILLMQRIHLNPCVYIAIFVDVGRD